MEQFEVIYNEFYSDIYRFLLRMTGSDHELAEDLTQECFYQAYISIHRFKGKCSIKTWLCQIAKNCYFNHLRKKKINTFDISLVEETLIGSKSVEPEYHMEKKAERESLIHAIKKLSKKQQDVFILRIYFELSYAEVSHVLKIKEGTAKVLFHRAKESLIESLG